MEKKHYLLTYRLPKDPAEQNALISSLQEALKPYLQEKEVMLKNNALSLPLMLMIENPTFSSLEDIIGYVKVPFVQEKQQTYAIYPLTPLEYYFVVTFHHQQYAFEKKFHYVPILVFSSSQEQCQPWKDDPLLQQYPVIEAWEEAKERETQ